MSKTRNNLYEFAEFRFEPAGGKLWRHDELFLLSPKACGLLTLLLERNGEFVSKEEIIQTVWADTFVEDGVLTQNIYTLRKLLGKDPDGRSLIENKTRLGYRMTAPIVAVSEDAKPDIIPSTIGTGSDDHSDADRRRRNWKRVGAFLAIVFVLLVTTSFVGYRFFTPAISAMFRKPIDRVKFTQLTNSGDLTSAALSPDGNFLAFVKKKRVYLKDTVSDKEIPLEIPGVKSFSALQFSADGNFLYFCDNDNLMARSKILRVSRFGGDTKLIVEGSYGRFSVSPDERSVAYYDVLLPDTRPKLLVRDIETKATRELLAISSLGSFCTECAPAWSPDGKKLIHINENSSNFLNQLIVVDLSTGKQEEFGLQKLRRFRHAFWFPDGESFVVSATDNDRYFHLWKVYYPNGDVQQITNGLSSYENSIVSRDGRKILTLRSTENANVFVSKNSDLEVQTELTKGNTNNFGKTSLLWTDESNVLFSAQVEPDTIENFWLVDTEGSGKRQITNEKAFRPNRPSSDGRFIYYSINRNRFANISRIDAFGGNLTDITDNSDGSRGSPQVSPDGNWLYYIYRNKDEVKILRRNLADRQEEVFLEDKDVQCGFFLVISPDGKYLACPNWRESSGGDGQNKTEVILMSIENRSVVKPLQISRTALYIRISPDSRAIEFIADSDDGAKIMRLGFDETEPKPILVLPNERIFNFAWSRSGTQLALSRGQRFRDAVLLSEFDQ